MVCYMRYFFERRIFSCSKILNLGYQKIVLIGTDVPMITEREIARAYQKLDFSDVVFGPSEDGGYYLVGMKRKIPIILKNRLMERGKFWHRQDIACIERDFLRV